MRSRWWWLRLQGWQWINALHVAPVRRTVSPLCWFIAAIVVPAGIRIAGPGPSRAALQWILSLDIPLALLVAAQVGSAAFAMASRADPESWISPRAGREAAGRMLRMVRWLGVVRWSAGLAVAALMLTPADAQSMQDLAELLLLSLLGTTCGALFAWNMIARNRTAAAPVRPGKSRVRGWAVLSRIAFQQTSLQLGVRRVALLTAPVMLAAPMGSPVQQIAGAIAAWVLLVHMSTLMREASRTVAALRKWMPRSGLGPARLRWLVWRYVVLAVLLSLAALWGGWRVISPGFSRSP